MAANSAEMIVLIDAQIESAVTNPHLDYKIGGKSVTWSKYIAELRLLRTQFIEQADIDIDLVQFENFNIDELGEVD